MVVKTSKGYVTYPAVQTVNELKRRVHEEHYEVFDYEEWLCSKADPKPIYKQ